MTPPPRPPPIPSRPSSTDSANGIAFPQHGQHGQHGYNAAVYGGFYDTNGRWIAYNPPATASAPPGTPLAAFNAVAAQHYYAQMNAYPPGMYPLPPPPPPSALPRPPTTMEGGATAKSYAAALASNLPPSTTTTTTAATSGKPAYTPVRFQLGGGTASSTTATAAAAAKKKLLHMTPAGAIAAPVQTALPQRPLLASEAPPQKPQGWPESLKNFVARIFDKAGPENRDIASVILKEYIAVISQHDKLWSTDWDNVVIPELDSLLQPKKKKKRMFSEMAPPDTQPSPPNRTNFNGSSATATSSYSGAKGPMSKQQRKMIRRDVNVFQQSSSSISSRIGTARNGSTSSASYQMSSDDTPPAEDWDQPTIVGTSTKLEKRYLRLTSAPDPKTVRPLHILEETMKLLKQKWKDDRDYGYICDQLKSVRQDLTVQMIRNEFTVNVYEIHARIALEKADLGEYNQCQSQLAQLYAMGIPGHRLEFLAYRLLYFLYTKNRAGVYRFLKELTPEEKLDPAVKHALAVRRALALSNYHALFRLYLNAVNMSAYLMDHFIERERVAALVIMCRAYRPHLAISFVTQELGFQEQQNEEDGTVSTAAEECCLFLEGLDEEGTIFVDPRTKQMLDVRIALPLFVAASQEKSGKVDIKGQI